MNSRGASPARNSSINTTASSGGGGGPSSGSGSGSGDTEQILAKVLPTMRVSPTPVTTAAAVTSIPNPSSQSQQSQSLEPSSNNTSSSPSDFQNQSPLSAVPNSNNSNNAYPASNISPNAPASSPSSSQPREILVVLPAPIADAEDETKRYCWVCFATDEDDMLAQWVQPCRCRGTTKWVHQACIQRWIDEKQKGNTAAKVSCPQCNTEYIIFYPKLGSLVLIMDSLDALISRVCPFVAAGIVVGSIYWTAVTYGAVTVMQVAGHKEGLSVMEQADPLVLLVGLPTIPVMLILGKMVRWEDQLLRFIRKHSWKIPLLRHILPSLSQPSVVDRVSQDLPALSDPVSATRILCGALLLPTVATVLGKVLFENVRSNFRRAVLGGVAFITIKGVLRIYHKQQQYIRQSERKIVDFVEPPRVEEPTGSGDEMVLPSALGREVLRHANLYNSSPRTPSTGSGRSNPIPINSNSNNSSSNFPNSNSSS